MSPSQYSGDHIPSAQNAEGVAGVAAAANRLLSHPLSDRESDHEIQWSQSEQTKQPRFNRATGPTQQSSFNAVNENALSTFGGAADFSFSCGPDGYSQGGAMDVYMVESTNMWGLMPSSAAGDFSGAFSGAFRGQKEMTREPQPLVVQQYGQTTPQNDTVDEILAAKGVNSDKSTRARNAANQRHAKNKKAQKDSRLSQASLIRDEESHTEDKKERYREKNRLAASKCRARKKENIDTLEDRHRNLSALNNVLKEQLQELRGELIGLRTHALEHQDCDCQISKYNVNQARRVAMGVDTASLPDFPGCLKRILSVYNKEGANYWSDMSIFQQSHQLYAAPSSYAFASGAMSGDMCGMSTGPDGDSHLSNDSSILNRCVVDMLTQEKLP